MGFGNILALKESFSKAGLNGLRSLVEYLNSPAGEEVTELGTGTIFLASPPDEKLTFESVMQLPEIYIGDPHRGITPLMWLTYLSRSMHTLHPDQLKALDEIFGSITASIKRVLAGDYEEVDFDDNDDLVPVKK